MDTVECPVGHVRVHNNEPCPYCEIAQLRRELEEATSQRNTAYEQSRSVFNKIKKERKRADELQKELEVAKDYIEKSIGIPATVWQETVDELKSEKKRADLNERALGLACESLKSVAPYISESDAPDYFRKLAQESK